MGHAGDADELFEVLGDELRPVVGDDAWAVVGIGLAGALDDGFHVGLLHFFADFPVHDVAAVAIEDGAEEVKSAGDIEIADVDVPVFVRLQGLHEARAFFGEVGRGAGQEVVGFEDAIDAGGAAGDDIGVEHHEGEPAIAIEGMQAGEAADSLFFVVGEPMSRGAPRRCAR